MTARRFHHKDRSIADSCFLSKPTSFISRNKTFGDTVFVFINSPDQIVGNPSVQSTIALVSHNINCRMFHRYTSGLLRSARNDEWSEIVIARSRRLRGNPEVLSQIGLPRSLHPVGA